MTRKATCILSGPLTLKVIPLLPALNCRYLYLVQYCFIFICALHFFFGQVCNGNCPYLCEDKMTVSSMLLYNQVDTSAPLKTVEIFPPHTLQAPSVDVSRTVPHASGDVATVKVDASMPDVKGARR